MKNANGNVYICYDYVHLDNFNVIYNCLSNCCETITHSNENPVKATSGQNSVLLSALRKSPGYLSVSVVNLKLNWTFKIRKA